MALSESFVVKPRIMEKLDEIGKNRSWLARQLGRSRQQINEIAMGRSIPGLTLAYMIAGVLRCTIEDLWIVEEK